MSSGTEAAQEPVVLGPDWTYEFGRLAIALYALAGRRAQGFGSGNVPNGPVILALQGGSRWDRWFAELFLRRHVEVLVGSSSDSDSDSDASRADALAVLGRGGAVAVRVSRSGVGSGAGSGSGSGSGAASGAASGSEDDAAGWLALQSGAPVVPVVLEGVGSGAFAKLVVRYGRAFGFERMDAVSPGQARAVTREVARRVSVVAAEAGASEDD